MQNPHAYPIGINSDDSTISPIGPGSLSESPKNIDLSSSFSISLVITDFRESLQQLIAIKQNTGAEAEGYKQISDALQNRLSQQDNLSDLNSQIPLDLYSENEDEPTILNLVLETEDEALFSAIIQYANHKNCLDDLVGYTLSYAEKTQQYRSLCWFAAQKNSPLFPDALHECFVIPETWLEGANASLLGGIFNNYKKRFDDYKKHLIALSDELNLSKNSIHRNQNAIDTASTNEVKLNTYARETIKAIKAIRSLQIMLNQAKSLNDSYLIGELSSITNEFFVQITLENFETDILADLICYDGLCHPDDLREELKNRYVRGPDKAQRLMNSDNPVRRALQEKYDFYQKANRVADFYKDASLHVIEKSQYGSDENKEIYKNKLKAISTQIADTLNEKSLPDLSAQAGGVADKLLSNTDIQKTTGFFRPCWGLNKTETEIKNRQKALGWQPKARELNQDTEKIDKYLTTDTLFQIPLSKEEQDACVKRAVEARAVFQETLNYLSNRYGDKDVKLTLLEKHIQYYIRGYDNDGNEYSVDSFCNALKLDNELAKPRHWWTQLLGFQTTTVKKLTKASQLLKLSNLK